MTRALLATALAAVALAAAASGATGGGSRLTLLTTGCMTYGTNWARTYNQNAVQVGNPVRILAACCHPTGKAGVHHCFVQVTLSGTTYQGCESVDIGRNGLPASVGRHERCLSRVQPVA